MADNFDFIGIPSYLSETTSTTSNVLYKQSSEGKELPSTTKSVSPLTTIHHRDPQTSMPPPLRELTVHKFLNGYNKKKVRLLNTKADAQHYHDNIGEVRVQKGPSNALDFHVDFPEKFEQDWQNLLMWQEDIEREGKMHKVLHIHLPATSRDFTLSTSFLTMTTTTTTTRNPPNQIVSKNSLIMNNNQSHVLFNIPLFEEITKARTPNNQDSFTNKTTLINIDIPSAMEKMFIGTIKLLVNGQPMAGSYSANKSFWTPKNTTKVEDEEKKPVSILNNNTESPSTAQIITHPTISTTTNQLDFSNINITTYIQEAKNKLKKRNQMFKSASTTLSPNQESSQTTFDSTTTTHQTITTPSKTTTNINNEHSDETDSTLSITFKSTTTSTNNDSTESTIADSTSKSPTTLQNNTQHTNNTIKSTKKNGNKTEAEVESSNFRILNNVFPVNDSRILKKIKYNVLKPKRNKSAWPKSNYIDGNWFLVTGGKGNHSTNNSGDSRGIGLLGSCDLQNKNLPEGLYGHMVTLFENKPVICGGFSKTNLITQKCYIYKDGEWNSHLIPPIPSISRGSLVSVRTKLYLVGGKDEDDSKASSKTMVFDYNKWKKWKEGTSLQKSREGACTVVWKGVLIVIGGGNGNDSFADSEIYNTNGGWKWKQLPWDMNLKRKYHGCAAVKSVVYVVGGVGSKDSSKTIEYVDFSSNQGWKLVTRLHSPRNFYPQVQIIQRDMFVFYGKTHPTRTFEIIELDSKSWLKRKSRTPLMDARVFTLSNRTDYLDTCNEFIRTH